MAAFDNEIVLGHGYNKSLETKFDHNSYVAESESILWSSAIDPL
jgi:hypothetical protein